MKPFSLRQEPHDPASSAANTDLYAGEGSLLLWLRDPGALESASRLHRDNLIQAAATHACPQVDCGPNGPDDLLLLLGAGLGEARARRVRRPAPRA